MFERAVVCRAVVEEKEQRQEVTMVIMGLTPGVSVLAWTLTYMLIFTVV